MNGIGSGARRPSSVDALVACARTLSDAGIVPSGHLHERRVLVSASPAVLSRVDRRERVVISTGMILARLQLGDTTGAGELAAAERAREVVGTTGVATRDAAAFWVAVAAVGVLTGRLRLAAETAERALGADSTHREAAGLLAMAMAMNGEYGLARAQVSAARRMDGPRETTFGTAVADALVAAGAGDERRLREAASELDGMDTEWGRAAAGALTGRAAVLAVLPGDAVSSCSALVSGVRSGRLPQLLRRLAVESLAAAHLVRGDFRRALAVLGEETSDPVHAVCLEGARAAAHLALGDPRSALHATDVCVRVGLPHSLRTLPSTLTVRAAAFARVGGAEPALLALEEAVQILDGVDGAMLPPLGVSSAELTPFSERLLQRGPHLRSTVESVMHVLESMPSLPQTQVLPVLTRRESVVAWALGDRQSVSGIAESLGVSANTVKSQLRQLYAKLEVSSRLAAFEKLQHSGFYTGDRSDTADVPRSRRVASTG